MAQDEPTIAMFGFWKGLKPFWELLLVHVEQLSDSLSSRTGHPVCRSNTISPALDRLPCNSITVFTIGSLNQHYRILNTINWSELNLRLPAVIRIGLGVWREFRKGP